MPTPSAFAALMDVCNPKRTIESRRGRAGWYEYYAGFSPSFVRNALALSQFAPGSARVLDPWNGSGTTTEVGALAGFEAVGFDLNPVMVLVAKARALQSNVHPSIGSLLEQILLQTESGDQDAEADPLESWFSARTSRAVRRIERSVQTVLVGPRQYVPLSGLSSLRGISPLAAFFYVALFRVLRRSLDAFRCSNPTWFKGARSARERVHISRRELLRLVRDQVKQMSKDLEAEEFPFQLEPIPANIDVASSLSLPLERNSVQLVITSPPYCTRIDYVVKTAPELGLLGLRPGVQVRGLRDEMIGTPTIASTSPPACPEWGKSCLDLLDGVTRHESRASRSYYLKTYLQYFNALYRSLREIDRTLCRSGECFLVVQDSHYKEIRVDLAQIATEMAGSVGWRRDLRRDFRTSRTMVTVNRGARAYNNPRLAVESVLHFIKDRTDG